MKPVTIHSEILIILCLLLLLYFHHTSTIIHIYYLILYDFNCPLYEFNCQLVLFPSIFQFQVSIATLTLFSMWGRCMHPPPCFGFCPILKTSKGNPYLKIFYFSKLFVTDAPMKKSKYLALSHLREHLFFGR